MLRPRLFQIVDPNAGQTCTIVSFQKCDRNYIEQRKTTLEKEIRAVLAPGESENVFLNDNDGIWFGGHVRTRNGKPIALNVPHRADMEYIQQAESRLKTPNTKRDILLHLPFLTWVDLPVKSLTAVSFRPKQALLNMCRFRIQKV
jgi:hypothetical protein